ncbi:NAD(P)-binding protein [Pleurotus eryngii]|uniref:NAD(P)-binding protein n=1 Tax=Pleurotus eryngii TaxID=5323 RepID=A0A9P5ZKR5_PLEER|nr:NAD(P)-binding protein [Pleurotus eryngii]
MPTIVPGSKVLVTGATGFVGAWVARNLLEKGYSVRAAVRSASKVKYLTEYFKSYGDKFETVIVGDMSKDGAFDEAVKGVDGIEHIASPVHLNADDPQELIGPAVSGTVGILNSALRNNPTLKRVVITSSTAAVLEVLPEPKVFSELNWNRQAVRLVEEQGRSPANFIKYRASKVLAETAAWDFAKTHKGEISWDITVVVPPYVFGPVIHEVASREALNTSSAHLLDLLLTPSSSPNAMSTEALTTTGSSWIDVRDVAEAHTRALERAEAGGERIIVCAEPFVWQDWIDVARSLSPPVALPPHHQLAVGVPGGGKNAVYKIRFDASKAARILGIEYRSKEEPVRALLEDVVAKGW